MTFPDLEKFTFQLLPYAGLSVAALYSFLTLLSLGHARKHVSTGFILLILLCFTLFAAFGLLAVVVLSTWVEDFHYSPALSRYVRWLFLLSATIWVVLSAYLSRQFCRNPNRHLL